MGVAANIDVDVATAAGAGERRHDEAWMVVVMAGHAVDGGVRNAVGSVGDQAMNGRAVDGAWNLRLKVDLASLSRHFLKSS